MEFSRRKFYPRSERNSSRFWQSQLKIMISWLHCWYWEEHLPIATLAYVSRHREDCVYKNCGGLQEESTSSEEIYYETDTKSHLYLDICTWNSTYMETHTHTNTLPVTSHSDSVLHQLRCTSSNVFSEGHFCVCPFTWQVALIKQWNQRGMSKFLVLFASTNWDSLYDARSKLANCVR